MAEMLLRMDKLIQFINKNKMINLSIKTPFSGQ